MSFGPDRMANLLPKTCPSSTNDAWRRLQLALGAAAPRCRRCDLPRPSIAPKGAGGPIRGRSFDTIKHNEQAA